MMNYPQFDASSDPQLPSTPSDRHSSSPRPFLGIRFQCCKAYGRIYRNEDRTAYQGQCPKCGARLTVPIGDGGTSSRFFNAG